MVADKVAVPAYGFSIFIVTLILVGVRAYSLSVVRDNTEGLPDTLAVFVIYGLLPFTPAGGTEILSLTK